MALSVAFARDLIGVVGRSLQAFLDRMLDLADWLSGSHGSYGGLFWDLLLVLFTVWAIPRCLEYRERRRWFPAKMHFYVRLVNIGDTTLRDVLPDHGSSFAVRSSRMIPFGRGVAVGLVLPRDFKKELDDMEASVFRPAVEEIAKGDPNRLSRFRGRLEDALGGWSDIFLSNEPELNRLVSDLGQKLAVAESQMGLYIVGRQSEEQMVLSLQDVARSACALRDWLVREAEKSRPKR